VFTVAQRDGPNQKQKLSHAYPNKSCTFFIACWEDFPTQTQAWTLINNFSYVFVPHKLSLQSLCVLKFSKIKIVIEIWKSKAVLPECNAQMFLLYLFWKFDYVWVLFHLRSVLPHTLKNDNTENTFWFHLLGLMEVLTNTNSKYKVQGCVKW
jgi:hypothetical protein